MSLSREQLQWEREQSLKRQGVSPAYGASGHEKTGAESVTPGADANTALAVSDVPAVHPQDNQHELTLTATTEPVEPAEQGSAKPAAVPFRPELDLRAPEWVDVPGMRMVPIDSIDPSPFRARFVATYQSVEPLIQSLSEQLQPLRPLEVRKWTGKEEGREQLLKGHRTLVALQLGFGATEVAVVDAEVEDDFAAAVYVNGDNDSDYKDSFWERMRKVGMYIRVGGPRATQRSIARRHNYHESEVSEFIRWDEGLSPKVLKMADVSEDEHQHLCARLERKHFRMLRECKTDRERARLLKDYIHGKELKKTEPSDEEIGGYLTVQVSGGDWSAMGRNLDTMSDREFAAVCKRIKKGLADHRKKLIEAGRAAQASDAAK